MLANTALPLPFTWGPCFDGSCLGRRGRCVVLCCLSPTNIQKQTRNVKCRQVSSSSRSGRTHSCSKMERCMGCECCSKASSSRQRPLMLLQRGAAYGRGVATGQSMWPSCRPRSGGRRLPAERGRCYCRGCDARSLQQASTGRTRLP